MTFERLLPWLVRATWAALPFTAGPALGRAVEGWARAPQVVATVGLWGGWGVVLVATLVAHPISLTVLRVGAPCALACGVAARSPLAAGWGVLVVVVALAPATGVWCVNGLAYPNERRFPLRAPGPLLAGPLELAWALTVAAPSAGALLLADRRWVAGGVVLAIGVPVAVVLARSMHGLSRRWVVFVPAGLVLHDHLALTDPVLFIREVIESVGPAPADTDSLDLTQGAPGLALEVVLREKVPMVLTKPGRKQGESGSSARMLFMPTRPGAVLAEARSRRLPVTTRGGAR